MYTVKPLPRLARDNEIEKTKATEETTVNVSAFFLFQGKGLTRTRACSEKLYLFGPSAHMQGGPMASVLKPLQTTLTRQSCGQ